MSFGRNGYSVRVDTLLAPPVISCNSTTSTDFTWNNVPGATSYTVNLLNGSGGTHNGGFGYNVNGITVGDSSTIEVVANGPTVCGPSSSTLTCYAAPCPPIELTLDPIPDICLYPNTLATNLNDFLYHYRFRYRKSISNMGRWRICYFRWLILPPSSPQVPTRFALLLKKVVVRLKLQVKS
ncbi:MAG: hypothetical protein R2769_08040 [Saprospiraceae bacterium]